MRELFSGELFERLFSDAARGTWLQTARARRYAAQPGSGEESAVFSTTTTRASRAKAHSRNTHVSGRTQTGASYCLSRRASLLRLMPSARAAADWLPPSLSSTALA
jgi:hypothetical protein